MLHRLFCALSLSACLTLPSNAASISDIDAYIATGDFTAANQTAATLDASEGDAFYQTYVAANQRIANNDCLGATPLLESLGVARPNFLPAHQLLYLCDMARNDPQAAAIRLDVMLAVLPEGPMRDQTLTLRRSLTYATGPVFSAFGEVVPSTNVTKQTSADDLNGWTIPDQNRATKGVTVSAGGSATFGLYSQGNWGVTGVVRIEGDYNTVEKNLAPRLSFEIPTTIQSGAFLYGFGPLLSFRFHQGKLDELRYGGKGFASWRVDQRSTIRLDTQIYRAYRPELEHLNLARLDGTLAYSYVLTPELMVTTRVTGILDLYDEERLRRTTLEAGVKLDYAGADGWLLGGGVSLGTRLHNSPPPMSFGPNQKDSFAVVQAEIGHTALSIGPVTPMLTYQYTKQWSDNVFYQHDSHDFGIKLRATF